MGSSTSQPKVGNRGAHLRRRPGRGDIAWSPRGLDAMNVVQQHDLLYVALGDFFAAESAAGLAVVDIGDPAAPQVLGTWRSEDPLKGVADIVVEGTIAYLAAMHYGVIVVDVADPALAAEITRFRPDPDFPNPNPGAVQRPNARGLALEGDRLFVAYDAGGLRVFDVTDPAAPNQVGRHLNPGPTKQQAYNDLVIDGDIAYVALDYCGLEVVNIADLAEMATIAWLDPWDCNSLGNLWFNSPGHTNQLHLDRERAMVWVAAGDSELLGVDVADRTAPRVVAQVGGPRNERGTYGMERRTIGSISPTSPRSCRSKAGFLVWSP